MQCVYIMLPFCEKTHEMTPVVQKVKRKHGVRDSSQQPEDLGGGAGG